ncbi:crossover junction endodeoxyribonuclease RuvC [Candidatus Gracilibacteria bacterium]|nr:crossover junction endodeoxyribonuclease RuvC [Candidatus Gracilibacteria bacterium]
MKILGIDPGLETIGFAIIEIDHPQNIDLIDYGVILTKSKTAFEKRLLQISQDLNNILDEFEPDFVSIERLFFGTNITNGIQVAHARGVCILEIVKRGIEIYEFSPNEMKSIICGNGLAKKDQVQFMIKSQLGLTKIPKPDDAADAIGLAMCLAFSI